MNRSMVLLTVLALACGGTTHTPQQTTSPVVTTTVPAPNPTPILPAQFCVGTDAAVQFDDKTPFLVGETEFPFTLKGEFRGCPMTFQASYDFSPLHGSPVKDVAVPATANGDGTWSYTFPTNLGLGDMIFRIQVADANGNTHEALWSFWIKEK